MKLYKKLLHNDVLCIEIDNKHTYRQTYTLYHNSELIRKVTLASELLDLVPELRPLILFRARNINGVPLAAVENTKMYVKAYIKATEGHKTNVLNEMEKSLYISKDICLQLIAVGNTYYSDYKEPYREDQYLIELCHAIYEYSMPVWMEQREQIDELLSSYIDGQYI